MLNKKILFLLVLLCIPITFGNNYIYNVTYLQPCNGDFIVKVKDGIYKNYSVIGCTLIDNYNEDGLWNCTCWGDKEVSILTDTTENTFNVITEYYISPKLEGGSNTTVPNKVDIENDNNKRVVTETKVIYVNHSIQQTNIIDTVQRISPMVVLIIILLLISFGIVFGLTFFLIGWFKSDEMKLKEEKIEEMFNKYQ